jgi:hypothetical protein
MTTYYLFSDTVYSYKLKKICICFCMVNVRKHNNGYTDVSFWEIKTPAQGLRRANKIKRVYASCIITQKIHYNATYPATNFYQCITAYMCILN